MEGHGDKTKELKDLLFYLDIVKYLTIAKNPTLSRYQYHTVPKLRLHHVFHAQDAGISFFKDNR